MEPTTLGTGHTVDPRLALARRHCERLRRGLAFVWSDAGEALGCQREAWHPGSVDQSGYRWHRRWAARSA